MAYDAEVIVIGSGAGGGTFAYACAVAGKNVILLERGTKSAGNGQLHDERTMLIEKTPYDDRSVYVNGQPKRLYMGGVFGGGTSLYGAVLMRPSPEDFHPGRSYGGRIPQTIWDWPISYDTLEPYYTEAEALYGVAGCGEDDFGPLGRPKQGFPHPVPPLQRINRRLMAANRAGGLKPFRLPLAIDFRRCLRCDTCPGYLCPNGARRSSAHLAQRTAEGGRLRVMTGAEAEAFCKDGAGKVSGVRVLDRASGRRAEYRAQRYALAAGAIGSPALLLRSGIGGPLVGCHYMFHLSPIVVGFFAGRTEADSTFVKQVGFADYYFGTKRFAHKLGLIQSLPAPGPLMMAKAGGGHLPAGLARFLRGRMLPLVGIVEDLPNPANRVTLGKDGGINLTHAFSPYDLERGGRLGRLMSQILRRAGALFCMKKVFPSEEHVAHQCGTLRFGLSPAHAVADPDCRVFGQPNLFVVDGSVFPTSLGVGPALTIMANALRVASVAVKEI
jgi:choline dehydrogenase-like flavoprotein